MRTPSRYMHDFFRGVLDRVAVLRNGARGAATGGAAPDSREPSVDVVVCVYNALPDVRRCVASVLRCLDSRTRLVVVNDASDEETSAHLRALAARHPLDVHLIEHAVNRGYTQAINTGLRASSADYVVLLNSDTIVTPGWVERIVACGESDPRIGVVGPLSNAASWQTVPTLLADDGTFCINQLPPGHSVETFAALVAAVSKRSYPRVPLVNGFCFAIKRAAIDGVGEFDAIAFPRGYGEENDYCLRVSEAGFTLAVADDAYVFHAKSKSFGHADRRSLTQAGKLAFEHKHGKDVVAPLVRRVRDSKELAAIRGRVAARSAELPAERILFLLPVAGGGGGAHSVVQEVAAMRRQGVDARVAVERRSLDGFLTTYRAMPERADIFVPYSADELLDIASDCSIVIATVFTSVALLRRIVLAHPAVLPAYYVQDYEPLFFEPNSPEHREACASYSLIPGTVLFAKTAWIADIVREHHGVEVHKVTPSLDHAVYRPAQRSSRGSAVQICAMIRPKTPRRGASRTMRVLGAVQEKYGDRVSLHIFGCSDDDPGYVALAHLARCTNHGVLDREGVAKVLQASDVFVDLSDYQAFGRTGLEAMACGCAVLNPRRGGTSEYSSDGVNSLLVDTSDESACIGALRRLIESGDLRRRLGTAGIATAAAYTPREAAESELRVLRAAAARVRESPGNRPIRVRALVGTHNGRYTGSAFVRVLQPYSHHSLASDVLFEPATVEELLDEEAPQPCDALLIQRDAAADVPTARTLIDRCRDRGIRVVYEVDDLFLDPAAIAARAPRAKAVELARLSRYVARRADAVVVSSPPLADAYRSTNERVVVVPNALDPDLWRLDADVEPRTGDVVRIGFMGTFGHGGDLDLIAPAIERIAEEYGSRVSFELIGGRHGSEGPFRRIDLPTDARYPAFVQWFRERARWHIGLIPLVDDEFNRAKSYVKWLEYSALGIASVCSDVAPYRQVVENGRNGLLVAGSPDDWYAALRSLIEDSALRDSIARQARADVQRTHTLEHTSPLQREMLYSLWEQPRERASLFARRGTSRPAGGSRFTDLRFDSIDANGPLARSKRYQRLKRRAQKLARDPQKFMTDSRFSVVRRLGRTGWFS